MSALTGLVVTAGTVSVSSWPSHSPLPGEPAGMVLWALPVVKLLFNLSAAGVLGTLVLTIFGLSPNTAAYRKALNFAAVSAAVWTAASVASAVLAYLDVAPSAALSDESFGPQFGYFLTTVSLGQTWLITTLIAAVVTVLCLLVAHISAVVGTTVVAIAGLVPLTFNSHPNFGADQGPAMAALGVHIIAAAVWMGGLMALVAIRKTLSADRLVAVIKRFSTLALVSFTALAASGLLQAAILIGALENWWSPYGFLVLAKVAALAVLGLAGFFHRRWLISHMATNQPQSTRYFWAFVVGELLILGIASGLAVGLTRTDDPSPDVPADYATLAERIVDYPLPADPTFWNFLTETRFDPVWVLLCVVATFTYLAGVHRLHRRGARWPRHRTALWLVGVAGLLYASNGGVNAYREFLFTAQTIAHMMLLAIVPLFLVLATPLRLATQTVHHRTDGSRGGGEWLTMITESRLAAFATTPVAAAGIFVASWAAFYYPPLLGWSISDPIGHQWMIVSALFVGIILAASAIRSPSSIAARLSAVVVVAAIYTIAGVVLLTSAGLLQPDGYGALAKPWGVDPVQDQQASGALVLSIGVLHAIALAVIATSSRHRENQVSTLQVATSTLRA